VLRVSPRRFPIAVDPRFRLILRVFGVRPGNAHVDVNDLFDARFGNFSATTPVANISHWTIEGPWSWVTAIGVRMSVRHRDITFGGNARGGVRVDFHEPVRVSRFSVPALYVTVEDMEGLAAVLTGRGISGEDRRRR
jgi:hypothetical protein